MIEPIIEPIIEIVACEKTVRRACLGRVRKKSVRTPGVSIEWAFVVRAPSLPSCAREEAP